MGITRTSGRPVAGTLFFTMKEIPALEACYKESADVQKKAFVEAFKDINWQTEWPLSGLKRSNDFYANKLVQIKMEQLCTGRVVLLGDAGYCPSPFTGLATNLCLVEAYVLAGELNRQGTDVLGALKSYDDKMRRFIEECQQLSSKTVGLLFPSLRLGVLSMHQLIWAMSKINGLFPQSQQEISMMSVFRSILS